MEQHWPLSTKGDLLCLPLRSGGWAFASHFASEALENENPNPEIRPPCALACPAARGPLDHCRALLFRVKSVLQLLLLGEQQGVASGSNESKEKGLFRRGVNHAVNATNRRAWARRVTTDDY
jgi:hypothetical protein